MARLQLDFPDHHFIYDTTLTVRITDINAGNHLANDSMISMISEALARFLFHTGVPELSDDKTGIIFKISRLVDGCLIALAKSGFVFFNYQLSKVVPLPEHVLNTFKSALADKAASTKK